MADDAVPCYGKAPSNEGNTQIGYDLKISSVYRMCAIKTSSSDVKAAR